ILVLILWYIYTCSVQAQTTIIPEKLTLEDGLSQGFVSCLHQDREGFIWIGTKNGLNRYDGHRFEVFTSNASNPYSTSNDGIEAIEEAGDFLIVYTKDGKLQLLHKQTKRFYQVALPDQIDVNNITIGGILKDEFGHFWINASRSHRIIRVVFPPLFWEQFPSDTSLLDQVEANIFLEDAYWHSDLKNGQLLVQIKERKATVDIETLAIDYLSTNHPMTLLEGYVQSDEKIGFGRWKDQISVFVKDSVKPTFTHLPYFVLIHDATTELLWTQNDQKSTLWAYPLQTILDADQVDPKNAAFKIPLQKETIISSLMDRSGNLWLGTAGYGLLKINPRLLQVATFVPGWSVSHAPFAQSKKEFFVKLFRPNNDYDYLSERGSALKAVDQFLRSTEYTGFHLAQAQDTGYWLLLSNYDYKTAQDRLTLYNILADGTVIKKQTYDRPHVNVEVHNTILTTDKARKKLFIIADKKLIVYDPATDEDSTQTLQQLVQLNTYAHAIATTPDGQIWIGTPKGLIQLKVNGEEVLLDKSTSGLLHNDCASLLPDSNDPNALWIGTKGGGLHRLNIKTLAFEYLNSYNGLPNDVIYSVLDDEQGNLWMSSNKGIISYKPTTGSIRNFTTEDGMQSNEFNTYAYAKAEDGSLFFGGINGLNVFDPKDLAVNPNTPSVRITQLEVNNQLITPFDSSQILTNTIEFTKQITLPYSKNNITLEFAALEFTAPQKNTYRYYLEGTEEEWQNETTDNRATYLNLPPGKHLLSIKASNGDGVWSDEVTELWINIKPPWYRTGFAYFGYLLLLLASIWLFLRFQQNRLRLQYTIDLEQKEAERLRELDRFRSRLYTNITHEFRTPLTVILGTNQQLATTDNNRVRRRKFGLINRNANNLLQLVNQLLDLSKIEHNELQVNYIQGNLLKYVRYITESFHSLANAKNVLLQVESQAGAIVMDYDPTKMQQILSNLFSNAIKYTPSGGKVTIALAFGSEETLEIMVQDTGKGIPAADLPHIFNRFYQADDDVAKSGGTGIGLALTQELVRLLKGTIRVESRPDSGTTFTLQLPITKQADFETGKAIPIPKLTAPLPYFQEDKVLQNRKAQHLLIIEDNPDVVEYLTACLA
ncbi:MAG: ATP-binding protein, partial [Bacteroidota bacterium]